MVARVVHTSEVVGRKLLFTVVNAGDYLAAELRLSATRESFLNRLFLKLTWRVRINDLRGN
jgi:hypothetical protein